jgi:hypothetical protein
MEIVNNFLYYVQDLQEEVQNVLNTPAENADANSFKKFTYKMLDVWHKGWETTIIHYPKTVLVALAVSAVASLVFVLFSPASLLTLGLDCYLGYKYKNLIFTCKAAYDLTGISEWSSSNEAKILCVKGLKFGENTAKPFLQKAGEAVQETVHQAVESCTDYISKMVNGSKETT